jgi:hypothetical protein
LIQPFQQPERVVGFFNTYRQLYPVTRHTLRDIADQFQRWVAERAEKRNIPIVEAPKGRRDDFVDPYFELAKPDAIVVILKAREPARIMTAIGDKVANRWHLQFAQRWVAAHNGRSWCDNSSWCDDRTSDDHSAAGHDAARPVHAESADDRACLHAAQRNETCHQQERCDYKLYDCSP